MMAKFPFPYKSNPDYIVASSCFFHLRRIRKLRTVLDVDLSKRLVCALVLTRIDYCKSVLAGLPNSTLAPLQRVLNAAARFVANLQPRSCHRNSPSAALASDSSAIQLQAVHAYARCTFQLCAAVGLHLRRRHTGVGPVRPSQPAIGCQLQLRRSKNAIKYRTQSFLRPHYLEQFSKFTERNTLSQFL